MNFEGIATCYDGQMIFIFANLSAVSLFLLSPYLSGMLLATFPSIVTVVHALFEPCLKEI